MPLNALGLPFSYAFSGIFANKLLISVRCAYYNPKPSPSEFETDYPSIQFKSNKVTSSSSVGTDEESIDEGLGAQ